MGLLGRLSRGGWYVGGEAGSCFTSPSALSSRSWGSTAGNSGNCEEAKLSSSAGSGVWWGVRGGGRESRDLERSISGYSFPLTGKMKVSP